MERKRERERERGREKEREGNGTGLPPARSLTAYLLRRNRKRQ